MIEPIKVKEINLTGKIINLEQDYLGNKKTRFYLVFKDKNGLEVEAFPITSSIEFKDNRTRYLYVLTRPSLPQPSLLLSDEHFKVLIERELALYGLERTADPKKRRIEYKLLNYKELFNEINKYSSN